MDNRNITILKLESLNEDLKEEIARLKYEIFSMTIMNILSFILLLIIIFTK